MFAIVQSPLEERVVSFPLRTPPTHQSVWLYISGAPSQLFFLPINEAKNVIKWTNENMEWHEGGGIKKWRMFVGKRENVEKYPKNPDILHYNYPPWWLRDSDSGPQ